MPKQTGGTGTGTDIEAVRQHNYDQQRAKEIYGIQDARISETPRGPALELQVTPPVLGSPEKPDLRYLKAARALAIKGGRTASMFQWVSPKTLAQAPYTITQTATAPSEEQTMAVNDAVIYLTERLGNNEALGPMIATYLIGDFASRRVTQEVLQAILGADAYAPPLGSRGGVNPSAEEMTVASLEDVIRRGNIDNLSPAQLGALQPLAESLLANLQQLPNTDATTEQLQKMIAVGLHGYQTVLSPEEVQTLTQLVGEARRRFGAGLSAGTTEGDLGPAAEALGIDQVRRQEGGVLVMDEEWAKANPAEAYAIQEFLEARFPGASIQYGKQGVIGFIANTLGRPVDYITSAFGAAENWISEYSDFAYGATNDPNSSSNKWLDQQQEFIEKFGFASPELRRGMRAHPEIWGDADDINDVVKAITRLRDGVNADLGWQDFQDTMYAGASPKEVGFGFATQTLRAAGVLPGDPGYDLAHASLGLIAQIVADPLNWGLPIIGGLRKAGRLPLQSVDDVVPILHGGVGNLEDIADSIRAANPAMDATEVMRRAHAKLMDLQKPVLYPQVARSWIEQQTYMNFARFPEEVSVTRPFIRAKRQLWKVKQATGDAFVDVAVTRGRIPSGVARELATATSEGDMGLAMTSAELGLGQRGYTAEQLDSLSTRLANAEANIAAGIDVEGSQVERAFVKSMLDGSDVPPATMGYIGGRPLRRMVHASGATTWDTVINNLATYGREFPSSIFGRSSRVGTAGVEMSAAEVKRGVPKIRRVYAQLKHVYEAPGFGDTIVAPTTGPLSKFARQAGLPSQKELAAALREVHPEWDAAQATRRAREVLKTQQAAVHQVAEESIQSVISAGRSLGHRDDAIGRYLRPWLLGEFDDNPAAFKKFFYETWETMVDESPVLPLIGKREMRQITSVDTLDRAGGRLGYGGTDPVIPAETRKAGQVIPTSLPSIDADLIQGIHLPSEATFREFATMTGRTIKRWELAGQPRHAVSTLHRGLAATLHGYNSLWRTAVLGTRLLFGLPARILGEQMLRIAAFDYASAVYHPSEWWRAMRARGEFAIWAQTPDPALGTFVNREAINPNLSFARGGKQWLDVSSGTPYFRSYSTQVARFYSSPSIHMWRLPGTELTSADELLRRLNADEELGPIWRKVMESSSATPAEIADNWVQELSDLIGTGEGAEYVKTAIRRGSVKMPDGKLYFAGTEEFADALQKMADDGIWFPGAKSMSRPAGDYIQPSVLDGMRSFRDSAFDLLYSRPDLFTSRRTMYRQVAKREYDNLLRLGYSGQTAQDVARSRAARKVADTLFDLGTKTSGELFAQNLIPFFPAYRELIDTWLIRAPSRIGRLGGSKLAPLGWTLGATELSLRAKRYIDFFRGIGVLSEDREGNLIARMPVFSPLIRAVTGSPVNFETNAPLTSFVGMFPIPQNLLESTDAEGRPLTLAQRAQGLLPSIGGWSSWALGAVREKFPDNRFGRIAEEFATLYGADQSFGPLAVDRLFQAFGIVPPLSAGMTKHAYEAATSFTVHDGIRIAFNETPAPELGDRDPLDPSYIKEYKDYVEHVIHEGEKYSTGLYLAKAVLGSALPFSLSITDERKAQLSAMWAVLNVYPDGSPVRSVVLDSVLETYPGLQTYMTGKTLDTRRVESDDDLNTFMDLVARDEEVHNWSPTDYAVFALGSTSYSLMQARIEASRRDSGDTYAERMLNFDAKGDVSELYGEWERFLDASEDVDYLLQGQTRSFKSMWDQYQQYAQSRREGKDVSLTTEQRQLIEFDRDMREFSKYFSLNPESAEEFSKLRGAAYEALGGDKDAEAQAVDWWFSNILDPYYQQLDGLYDKVNGEQTAPTRQSLIYRQIAKLRNHYQDTDLDVLAHENPLLSARAKQQGVGIRNYDPSWGDFPTPEEYSYAKLSPEDQVNERTSWANLPPEFLTRFQRDQVGYDVGPPKKVDALIDYMTRVEHDTRKMLDDRDIGTTTTEGAAILARMEESFDAKAEELGVSGFRDLQRMPAWERVGEYLKLADRNSLWTHLAGYLRQAERHAAAEDYALGGDTEGAEYWRGFVKDWLKWARDPREGTLNERFDLLIQDLEFALGGKDGPLSEDDLIRQWLIPTSEFTPVYEFEKAG